MKIILVFILILVVSVASTIDPYENYKMTKLDSLVMIDNYIDSHKFTHDKRLQDAGDFGRHLDTSIQRKVKSIKFESDKYIAN